MKTLARPALRSAATSISTMAGVRIRALTERHPIKPTSPRCHSAWQLNLGRHSTYRRGKSVQTTGTTSVVLPSATWGTLRATISAFENIVVYVRTVTKSYTYASTGYANPDAVTQIANGLSTTTFQYD